VSAERTDMHRLQDLVRLHRMGTGPRAVARQLHLSPNTERRYRTALAASGLLEGAVELLPDLEDLRRAVIAQLPPKVAPQQASSLDPWSDAIRAKIDLGAGPRAIYDALRSEQQAAFTGSLSAVKRFCRSVVRERGVRPEDVAIPVETVPGEVAQVDFGEVGRLFDPVTRTLRRAWVFVLVLGHSRHMWADITFDQKTETWLRLHAEAFKDLGGVVRTVVPDNLKAAVVRAAFGTDEATTLNRSYRELARAFGFKVDPAPVRQPKKKGKVEAAVKYVKRNFFAARTFADVDEARRELRRWVVEIAGTRVHGTTHRRPLEVFEATERAALLPLPPAPFELVVWHEAKVHADCHVAFDGALYSVPWKHQHAKVWIRATASSVLIYLGDERIADHSRRPSGRATREEHLPAERAAHRHRSRDYWEERGDRIGSSTGRLVRAVFDQDEVLSMLRTVQAIVTHLERFPSQRAEAASARALHFGNLTYGGIKDVLRRALDLQPLPPAPTALPASLPTPRFARSPVELVDSALAGRSA
jgi:transposase